MKISNKITKQLGTLIAGDRGPTPYLTGSDLVDFFNECGADDIYGEGFPTRWRYATEKIIESNGSDQLRTILEEFVDPRRYEGNEEQVQAIVKEINGLIKFDGFNLAKKGNFYKIIDNQGNYIEPQALSEVDHKFVSEQIEKCQQKITTNDFNGAITNARTLAEAVLIHVIENIEKVEVKNDGNILALWARAKKALKIDLKKEDIPDFVFQILAGLDTSLNGLAALSNNAGDRHANKFNTKKHHAKLAVNVSMTLSDFLVDVLNERNKNGL
ncbi:abortive infection family protein [Flavobacterium selenitireducens]|uniref:abortive infection family protein n=1 Tax=Flavobacterium selenitireducens TaxID=2722704 RepID=UPI00168B6E2F|nr:abortive infection family protein [Flavobacterium selenitireducens]